MKKKPFAFSPLKVYLTIAVVIILVIYSKILVFRIEQRAYIESLSSFYSYKTILVGSSGFGQITNIRVSIGSEVSEGDILFTFVKNDFSSQQDNVIRAGAAGRIQKINSRVGSYLTPDLTIMEIQSREIIINSKLKMDPTDISRLAVGAKTLTTTPDGILCEGTVTSIYPLYNNTDQTVDLESNLSETPPNILQGTPLKTKIYVGDDLATSTSKVIENIPIKFVKDFLTSN